MNNNNMGLDFGTISEAIKNIHGNIEIAVIHRTNIRNNDRSITNSIVAKSSAGDIKLIEKVLITNDDGLHKLSLLNKLGIAVPKVYFLDFESKAMLIEDLGENYITGFMFDEDNPQGNIYRNHINDVLSAVADLHLKCWDNYDMFDKIGLPWHINNFTEHMKYVENDYLIYKKSYSGKLKSKDFEIYEQALEFLNDKYPRIICDRFQKGKNITVIHGDFHPGNTFISADERNTAVKMIDFEAVRMGLATDDLAMFLALHAAPGKSAAMPFLNHYYSIISKNIDGYSFDNFISDYKASICENLFFPIRLINSGILDFAMAEKALVAYETFFAE
ncbi:MAG: aminoglycoside phosphotransferase family protein [Oscillospiraceae bacterium]|nr:aminoglycoside phosphotransferase family protein [Oscillospiraceae bacterium]